MNAGSVTINVGPLKALRADLKKYKNARVHVGVFAGSNNRVPSNPPRSDPNKGNADIGCIQEFGSVEDNIPERSFLRVPLLAYLPAAIRAAGPEAWRKSILKEGIIKTLERLGWTARNVVQDAFSTRGFGLWAPNAKRTIRRKKSDSPLIDTAQLRQAITHRVAAKP